MTLRERIRTVYAGGVPDCVPYFLDLSHWFYHRRRLPWNLSRSYAAPENDLIACHREFGAGFYLPNLASFYTTAFPEDVTVRVEQHGTGTPGITWTIETPLGRISRTRVWEEQTYAWGIAGWGIRTAAEMRVFGDAMSRRGFAPHWDRHHAWTTAVGDLGMVYMSLGYSAIGHLLNYWMGVEGVVYAAADMPALLHEVVDAVNANSLELVDLLCRSPAEVVIMGDNISSDVQSPAFFREWSAPYYREAIARLHRAGKRVAVHIDGRLRGALRMVREVGADCADAVTPTPMGDLTPAQCRSEAGREFILSGGVSPNLWMPSVPVEAFTAKVLEWLALKSESPALIANAGDQVPPGADPDRIHLMRELVERHGRY